MLQLSARFSAALQAFGSANSKASQTESLTTPVGTAMPPMLYGPTSAEHGSSNWRLCTSSLPQVQRAVIATALDDLFKKQWFDICTLNSIMKITQTGRGPAHKLLHALHCVHYVDMSSDVRDAIPALVRECLEPARSHDATAAIMGSL